MRSISVPTYGRVGHGAPITCLEFAPVDGLLATGSYDGLVIVWDRELRIVATLRHERLVNGVRWSPDGEYLATAAADRICRVWRVDGWQLLSVLARHTDDVNSIAWAADSSRLLTVSEDGTGRSWLLPRGMLEDHVLTHSDHCMSVDVNPRDGRIATCGEDSSIRLWDEQGRTLDVWPTSGDLEMCRWSPDGGLLAATVDDGTVRIFDGEGEERQVLGPFPTAVKSVAWSPEGSELAVGAYDGRCVVFTVMTGEASFSVEGPHLWPRAIDWSPSDRRLAVGTTTSKPEVVDLDRGNGRKRVRRRSGEPTFGINAIEPFGGKLAIASDDGFVHVWDPNETTMSLTLPSDGSLVNTVHGSPDDRLLAFGAFSGELRVHDVLNERLALCHRLEAPINQLRWSPDGGHLIVGDYNGRLHLFDCAGDSIAFSRCLENLHAGAVKSVRWLNERQVVTGATDRRVVISSSEGHIDRECVGHGNLVNAVDVGLDSKGRAVIASASRDRTVRLWDGSTGDCLRVLIGHDESVKAVAWRPDEAGVLLSGSYDFDARVWTLDTQSSEVESIRLEFHTNAIGYVTWWKDHPVTAGWDGRVVVWDVAGVPESVLELAASVA